MVYLLPFDAHTLGAYAAARRLRSLEEAAEALGRAIAGSPGWERFPGCRLVINPAGLCLALFGRLNDAQKAELALQADALATRCRYFRELSLAEIEQDCAAMAARLEGLLALPEWHDAQLTAIPRGGLHLLSRVSALLPALPVWESSGTKLRSPLIILDDCAYTGTRFRQLLARVSAPRVAFVTLYASPALRRTIVETEPRVSACLSMHDLGAAPLAGDPEVWRRIRAAGYLAEGLEVVCLPWKEPDRAILPPDTDRPIPAWRLIPRSDHASEDVVVGLPIEILRPTSA